MRAAPTKSKEELGVDLIMDILVLSKAKKPYRKEIGELWKYIKFPKVRNMLKTVVNNLKKGRK